MSAQPQNVNLDKLLKTARLPEFWRNNGNGTCTRLSDGLTVTDAEYNRLPAQMDVYHRRES
jgi:hypothetical protein